MCSPRGFLFCAAALAAIPGGAAGILVPTARAAVIDVVVAGTGGKGVTVMEGSLVTLDVFVRGVPDVGLGAFNFSLRSFDETFNSGAAWPVSRTLTDTVVSAVSSVAGDGDFVLWDGVLSNGQVRDLPTAAPPSGPGDANDTDLDVRDMSGFQGLGSGGYVQGLAQAVPFKIGSVTFMALDLDEATRAFARAVHVNTYLTTDNGANGGAFLRHLNPDDSLSVIPTGSIMLGGDVTITVAGPESVYKGAGGNWNDPASWVGGIVPNGPGARGRIGADGLATTAIVVDLPTLVARLVLDAKGYTIAGPQTLTFDGAGDKAALTVEDAGHVISAPVGITSDIDVSIGAAGSLSINGPLAITAGKIVTKSGAGALTINGPQQNGAASVLRLVEGPLHLVSNGGAPAASPATATLVLQVDGGTLTIGAEQDLLGLHVDPSARVVIDFQTDAVAMVRIYDGGTDSGATVSQATLDELWEDLASGNNGGTWDGNGIGTTTIVDADENGLGLSVQLDANGAEYVGVRELLLGDVNGDDFIDTGDATVLFSSLGETATWLDGDMNYDSFVDTGDATVLFSHLGQSFDPGFAGAPVPEPASFVLASASVAALLLLRMRRTKQRSAAPADV